MPAERLKRALIGLAREKSENRSLLEAANVLEAWDNRASVESLGTVLFDRWWQKYSDGFRGAWKTDWSPSQPYETPAGLGDPVVAARRPQCDDLRQPVEHQQAERQTNDRDA